MSEAPPFPSPTRRWHTKAQPSTSPTRPKLSAKGKSVIITGGGSTGIGGETARYFAEAGASRIALLGRREQPLLDNKAFIENKFPSVEVFTISTDVTKKSDVDAAVSQFAADGKINVLVHSAAAVGPKETVADVDGEKYLKTIQINVAGSLWVAQAFLRHAAPDAVAIAINSWGAHLSLNDAFASYCVANVFHTQPGVVLTEMNLSVGGAEISLPASFNVWLASPEARFLKGKFLWCNWDVDELKAQAKEIDADGFTNI
ncbi:NAD(P)-binding protein [Hymenopellis radicata]|nr:NAD(P)-binding protein [Hymenopellis radicata]